jgi:hypothetical protein
VHKTNDCYNVTRELCTECNSKERRVVLVRIRKLAVPQSVYITNTLWVVHARRLRASESEIVFFRNGLNALPLQAILIIQPLLRQRRQ